MFKIPSLIIIVLIAVCGYQYKLINESKEQIIIVKGMAKDTMAASLQQTLITIDLLKIKDKDFVANYLTEQAHLEHQNLIRYHSIPEKNDSVIVKRALESYSKTLSKVQ